MSMIIENIPNDNKPAFKAKVIPTGNLLDFRDAAEGSIHEKVVIGKNVLQMVEEIASIMQESQASVDKEQNIKLQQALTLFNNLREEIGKSKTLLDELANIADEKCAPENIVAITKQYVTQNKYQDAKFFLENKLGDNIWAKLADSSREFLINAKIIYDMKKADADLWEFTDVCICMAKAVDVEVTFRTFEKYVEYLNANCPNKLKWPHSITKDGDVISEKEFTLHTVKKVIGHNGQCIVNNYVYSMFKDYAVACLYLSTMTNNRIDYRLQELCACAETIRLKYRNESAHRSSMRYVQAKECMDYLLEHDAMLKEILADTAF